ncbi:MAG TPA: hypothetical protein PKV29_05815 [Trichococcus flocculiformis]|nr:hypothetical protein [Trichococcus flocculiformis]
MDDKAKIQSPPVKPASPEENLKKIITSDHNGFADVALPASSSLPADSRSPEMGFLKHPLSFNMQQLTL